jgi:hypothetical protein
MCACCYGNYLVGPCEKDMRGWESARERERERDREFSVRVRERKYRIGEETASRRAVTGRC